MKAAEQTGTKWYTMLTHKLSLVNYNSEFKMIKVSTHSQIGCKYLMKVK